MIIWKSRRKAQNKNDSAANANQTAQTNFYNTLTQNYNQQYGQWTDQMGKLNSVISPILNAGPGQYGFAPGEDAAIRGGAITADAAAATNAEAATNRQITAENGGASLMPTGAADELKQQSDVAAAQKTASDQNTITEAGYAQGNANYNGALSADEFALGSMNPNAFAGAASSGGSAATGAVNAATNADAASMSWLGALGSAAGGIGGGLAQKYCWIAAELYGGWYEYRTIAVRQWLSMEFIKTFYGKYILSLYTKFGRQVAQYIKTHRRTRAVFQYIFDKALEKAQGK